MPQGQRSKDFCWRKLTRLNPGDEIVSGGIWSAWSLVGTPVIAYRPANQDADEDLMTAAFEAGALAYVLKAEVSTKIIPAIQVALRTRV